MNVLDGIMLPNLPVTGLEKVQDLDQHDGAPIISHFRHPRGSHYLYFWCDCTDTRTRWMLIRVSETDILRLVYQVVPLDHVIPRACLDEFVYFLDVGDSERADIHLVALQNIPRNYHPGTVYLQVPECYVATEYALLIDKPQSTAPISTANIFRLPKLFSQVYAAIYAIRVLKPRRYEEIPWRDGFSGKRFYDWLIRSLPGEDRPEVEAFQFASPGFVKYSLRRDVGEMVSIAVAALSRNERDINKWYGRLDDFIGDRRLNDLYGDHADDSAWLPFNDYLSENTSRLMSAAHIGDVESLFNSATPFEAAKIVLSIIRRLRELHKLEREGIVRFPIA